MVFIAKNGDEWISREAYEAFAHRAKKVKTEVNRAWRNGPRLIHRVHKKCELCKKRDASTQDYKGVFVCQPCHLQKLDTFYRKHPYL